MAGTVATRQDAMDYLTWTYFFRRLLQNPTYYDLEGVDETNLNWYLTSMVDDTLGSLFDSGCIEENEEDGSQCTYS